MEHSSSSTNPFSSGPAQSHVDQSALGQLRSQIDQLDAQILELINARAKVAQEVGHVKAAHDAPVLRPEREAQILARQVAQNAGPIGEAAVRAIWREIISACRALETRLQVAFLGPRGTYTEQALLAHFGRQVDPVACVQIDDVFRQVQTGNCQFGVVPIENSTEGSVSRTLDLFLTSPLAVCAEISLPIRHHLLAREGVDLASAKVVKAHPQALAQCQGWLNQHAPHLAREPVSSNGEGARCATVEDASLAIAGSVAADHYGLTTLVSNIQDDPSNRTRFCVIGNHRCAPSGQDQTSLIVSVPDRAGAVHELIEPLARYGVSMKRFESRPARQSGWEYNFYIDLIGHQDDAQMRSALDEIRQAARFFKLVGSYPRASGVNSDE